MGYLKRVGDKKYRIMYDVVPTNGKKRQQKTETLVATTKKLAEAFLAKREAAVATGENVRTDPPSVAELIDIFMKQKRNNVAPKTAERYDQLFGTYIIPAFGHRKADELRQADLVGAYSKWSIEGRSGRPLSARSVRHVHDLLRNLLKWGVRMDYLDRNVASSLTTQDLPRAVKPAPRALDEEQVQLLLEAAKNPTPLAQKRGTVGAQSWFYPALVCSIFTGTRRGETLALRWADVDLVAKVATIRQSLCQLKAGLIFKEPKNGNVRTVNLPQPLVEVMERHRETQALERRLMGSAYQENGLIFASSIGEPIMPARYGDAVKDLMQRAQLPKTCLHDLRDTHASILAKRGVPLEVVSKRLGHSNIAITADRYLHIYQSRDAEAAEVLNDLRV